ncbi:STAS domain-containing protein [Candidatus Nitronereus thalassa]|uniref:Anti-sigma factor antagonist n=1 Tax=Candidatus Nitronereus thalassa TaxID=3020898 RepID=A0ABU3KAJ9_9BACT|nr:STAS domain-containing protein [Candidatus Nitronereus thalassa]MDT7043443.1 STAS domain-containing protein [Candidatus Nitronereus thalassa]
MAVSVRNLEDAVVLDLSGRFDATAKQDVQRAIDQAIDTGTLHLILNLAGVPIVDSAGLGLLAVNHHKFKEKGGRLSLINPQPEVRLILDMVAIPKLIPSYNSIEEALAPSIA